jgi:lysozyme
MIKRPNATRAQILDKLNGKKCIPCIVGVRGYYKDELGRKGYNDRGIYDDAIFVIEENLMFGFNANTDPSRYGMNNKIGKGLANLKAGEYQYKVGIHGMSKEKSKQYEALIQEEKVSVKRDVTNQEETGFFGINIHKGALNSTSSEGCQTIYPEQWNEFMQVVKAAFPSGKDIPYILIEN